MYSHEEMLGVDARWIGVGLPLLSGLLLWTTGSVLLRRPSSGEGRLALRSFALWWFAAGSIMFLLAAPTTLWLTGVRDPRAFVALTYAEAIPVALALFGLAHHLIFLYTGSHRHVRWLAAAYIVFFFFELYYFGQFGERHVEVTRFSVRAIAAEAPAAWLRILFGLMVAGPILLALGAYAWLWTRTKEREPRFRIAMVSAAFTVWFVPVLVGFVLGWDQADWFPIVYEAPGVLAAVLILLAYLPPPPMARWLHLAPIEP